ncbi:MAG: metal-dependent phosphohydrolase [Fimbriimonas sp.]
MSLPAFERACDRLGLAPEARAWLVAAYSEPQRRYHDLAHLEEVVASLEDADDEVLLAALFHDSVYDPRRGDNEARSAEALRERVPTASDRAVAAILATQTHQTDDPGIAELLDADLAVLGRPWEGYAAYARQIREEYAHVPDDAFAAGRAKVLRSFLERPRIYRTVRFASYEGIARQNIAQEIALLPYGEAV